MQSTTTINLNLQYPNYGTTMHAVQNDKLSRKVTALLYDGSVPFTPDADALALVRFHKPDNTNGFYDVDEDGNDAVTWSGNVATVSLAEQAITCPGTVLCQIQFYTNAGQRLTTFTWKIEVQEAALSDEEFISTDYYSVLTAQISSALSITYRPPYINTDTGHWMTWSVVTNQYEDSGYSAQGTQGETGPAGATGASMTGITKISGTGAGGTVDTYEVEMSNGSSGGTFQVYNGADGTGSPGSAQPLMDGTASAGSATAYSREDHVHPSDTSKVDVISGKGLSTNDFTTALKTKLEGIEAGADVSPTPYSSTPEMDGTAGAGSSALYARGDHIHPTDTSRQATNIYFKSTASECTVSSWTLQSTPTYPDFEYRADIYISGVTADMYAIVTFGVTHVLSGNYCPVCRTHENGIYIYSKTNTAITLQSIAIFK